MHNPYKVVTTRSVLVNIFLACASTVSHGDPICGLGNALSSSQFNCVPSQTQNANSTGSGANGAHSGGNASLPSIAPLFTALMLALAPTDNLGQVASDENGDGTTSRDENRKALLDVQGGYMSRAEIRFNLAANYALAAGNDVEWLENLKNAEIANILNKLKIGYRASVNKHDPSSYYKAALAEAQKLEDKSLLLKMQNYLDSSGKLVANSAVNVVAAPAAPAAPTSPTPSNGAPGRPSVVVGNSSQSTITGTAGGGWGGAPSGSGVTAFQNGSPSPSGGGQAGLAQAPGASSPTISAPQGGPGTPSLGQDASPGGEGPPSASNSASGTIGSVADAAAQGGPAASASDQGSVDVAEATQGTQGAEAGNPGGETESNDPSAAAQEAQEGYLPMQNQFYALGLCSDTDDACKALMADPQTPAVVDPPPNAEIQTALDGSKSDLQAPNDLAPTEMQVVTTKVVRVPSPQTQDNGAGTTVPAQQYGGQSAGQDQPNVSVDDAISVMNGLSGILNGAAAISQARSGGSFIAPSIPTTSFSQPRQASPAPSFTYSPSQSGGGGSTITGTSR